MSRPVHHVVLLLACFYWSGTVRSDDSSTDDYPEVSTTTARTCLTQCCPCLDPNTPPESCITCEDFNCDTMDCSCCVIVGGFAVEFMVAAQIALGAALLLAVSALSFLIWKMCFRNSIAMVQGRNRVRAFCGLPELPRRSSASSSLNSVQNFVIQKMRDRPPRYDESPPQMPPCYDEIVPSCSASSGAPVIVCAPATLPLYEQIYPGTSAGESSSAVAATPGAEISVNVSTEDRHHQDSGPPYSTQTNQNERREENSTILYDEACGGIDNPAFIPELQEQHI